MFVEHSTLPKAWGKHLHGASEHLVGARIYSLSPATYEVVTGLNGNLSWALRRLLHGPIHRYNRSRAGSGTPLGHPCLHVICLSAAEGYGMLSGAITVYCAGPHAKRPRGGTYYVSTQNNS